MVLHPVSRYSPTDALPAEAAWTDARRGIRPRTLSVCLAVVFLAALLASMLGAGAGAG